MKNDFSVPCDYSFLAQTIDRLCAAYPLIERGSIGSSMLGRDLPFLRIGRGKKKVLMVGAVHGSEHITAGLLLRFVSDYAAACTEGGTVYSLSMRYLYENRTLCIVPMLNPDGVQLSLHGPDEDDPMYDRLQRMCPNLDFTTWQANARGVDLNHNFNAGFEEYKRFEAENGITAGRSLYSGEYPESEPESAAIANLLRCDDFRMLLAFHTQGEELYFDFNGYTPPMGRAIGAALARMCSYRLACPEGSAVFGGLKDYFIRAFDRPGYTIECGRGENPLPQDDFFRIYATLREMLFHAVVMI